MNKLIIVIGDEEIVFIIRCSLIKDVFEIKSATDGASGLRMVKEDIPDLIILNQILPDLDGFEVCKEIRMDPRTAHIPLIILTDKKEEPNVILGLEMGADDFIIKPFSSRELLARVKAVLRRANRKRDTTAKLHYKTLVVDTEACTVKAGDSEVELTYKEFSLLVCLIKNKGLVMQRQSILESVWGLHGEIATRTVDNHILNLRKKIPILAESIVTIKQFGYKLKNE